MKLFKCKDEDVLLHSLILGPSKFSFEKVIKSGILTKIISDEDSILEFLICLRRTGRLVKQNQLLLCGGIFYSVHPGKRDLFCKKINDICKIPTDLFKIINIITNEDHINKDFVDLKDLKEFYRMIKTNPLNNKKRENQDAADGSSPKKQKGSPVDIISSGIKNVSLTQVSKEGGNNVFKFAKRHKFIEEWYRDPKKNALDLLYMLTKFKNRCGWDHKMILQHGHYKFKGSGLPKDNADIGISNLIEEGSDDRLGNINLVINYILHGVNNIKKVKMFKDFCERCHEPEYKPGNLPVDEITSRVIAAMCILEQSKLKKEEPCSESFEEKVAENIRKYKRTPQANSPYGGAIEKRAQEEEKEEEEERYTVVLGDEGENINYCFGSKFGPFVDESTEGPLDRFHFCAEHLPTTLYAKPKIWEALMYDMPITALIRHICYLAHLKVLDDFDNTAFLLDVLKCPRRLKQIHPFQILKVVMEYKTGGGPKKRKKEKKRKWEVDSDIHEALCEAFCLSLKFNSSNINDTLDMSSDLKYKVCIQASGSMLLSGFTGDPKLSGTRAAVAMAHAIQQFCPNTSIHICRRTPYLVDEKKVNEGKKKKREEKCVETDLNSRILRIKVHHNFDLYGTNDAGQKQPKENAEVPTSGKQNCQVFKNAQPIPKGYCNVPECDQSKKNSDLAAPITEAINKSEKIDAFIVFTTSIRSELTGESVYGEYCRYKEVQPGAKLIICAMDANPEVIADTKESNVKLICGADGFLLREIIQYMHPERCTVKDM